MLVSIGLWQRLQLIQCFKKEGWMGLRTQERLLEKWDLDWH